MYFNTSNFYNNYLFFIIHISILLGWNDYSPNLYLRFTVCRLLKGMVIDMNYILIGMPGCGKSTVGVVLAKKVGFKFIDSDLVIQEQEHKLLHEIISENGIEKFKDIENKVNAGLTTEYSVIATGGSVIYGRDAMEHLKSIGTVIYLKLSYPEIENRLGDLTERGVVLNPNQTLLDLYKERTPLYEKYSDVTVDCDNKSIREIVNCIVNP